MPKQAEVWYQDGSLLRSLAAPFHRQYSIRAFGSWAAASPLQDSHHLAVPDVPIVILGDLTCQDDVAMFSKCRRGPNIRLIGFLPNDDGVEARHIDTEAIRNSFTLLQIGVSPMHIGQVIEAAFANIESALQDRRAREASEHEREELNRVGTALSSIRNVNQLLELILAKTREITVSDAGSLYIVETSGSENGLSGREEKRLRFALTQNDTQQFPYSEFTLPINEESMAGYAALHGEVIVLDDVYLMPPDRPYRFNASYDGQTGYRTRSVLTVPMKNARGDVIGVMQLLNRKRHHAARLSTPADVDREVEPFPERTVRLAQSLVSQAAVAYENSRLYQNIHNLFEGFVKAAATAIEQRDPTTSGHSTRVTTMTLGLAEAVSREQSGPYGDVYFTPEQMKEIRYAALLHDFGKIGVREQLLVKAQKLYPPQLEIIRERFDYLYQELEAQRAQRKLEILARPEANVSLADIDAEYDKKQAELHEDLRFIEKTNHATVLPEGQFGRLVDIGRKAYRDPRGVKHNLLTPGEMASLSVRKGTLNEEERLEIEAHVVHSVNFLTQIPWTSDLKFIPWIVRAHHEKLNGNGYPYRLRGDEIPLQAKMMTICDVFDALCAADRPYKKAVPLSVAFEILQMGVQRNEIDAELFRIFKEARIFDLAKTTEFEFKSDENAAVSSSNALLANS